MDDATTHGEAQGSAAPVCIVPISLLRTVYRSDLSGMCESPLNRDTKEIILVEKRREVAVQGYQGRIVQLPSEVPLRKNPRAQQPSPSKGRCRFGEEDGSSESSPNLLFKPKGSENPDPSEPSALTVVR